MKISQIRALGFDWPGSGSMDQYAIEHGGEVDLDATLVALRRGLEVYQGELTARQSFQQTHNADASDLGDAGDFATKATEMRAAIQVIEAIKAKAPS